MEDLGKRRLPISDLVIYCGLLIPGILTFTVSLNDGQTVSFPLDVCELTYCGRQWAMARVTDPKYVCEAPCQTWSQVSANTDRNGQYNPFHVRTKRWSVTTEYQSPD